MTIKVGIIDLYEVHKALYSTFGKFDTGLIVFLKRVADNYVCSLSGHYNIQADDSMVDNIIEKNPNMDAAKFRLIATAIRSNIQKHYDRHRHVYKECFDVRCSDGMLIIDFTQPEIPEIRVSNFVDVPWGAPPGTISVNHMDCIIGSHEHVWCEDSDGEVDITINGTMFTVGHGLWDVSGEESVKMDLAEYTRSKMESSSTAIFHIKTKKAVDITPSSDNLPKCPDPWVRLIGGIDHLVVNGSMDYGDVDVSLITVDMVIPKGHDTYVPYSIIINSTPYDIPAPGVYSIEDGILQLIP